MEGRAGKGRKKWVRTVTWLPVTLKSIEKTGEMGWGCEWTRVVVGVSLWHACKRKYTGASCTWCLISREEMTPQMNKPWLTDHFNKSYNQRKCCQTAGKVWEHRGQICWLWCFGSFGSSASRATSWSSQSLVHHLSWTKLLCAEPGLNWGSGKEIL